MKSFFIGVALLTISLAGWATYRQAVFLLEEKVSDDAMIFAAIKYVYQDNYTSLEAFKEDYPSYNPRVLYWDLEEGEVTKPRWFFGVGMMAVRMPDAVVFVGRNGQALFSRRCSENSICSPAFAMEPPRLGIIIAAFGEASGPNPDDYRIQWVDGTVGTIFRAGRCFAAVSHASKPVLGISSPPPDTVMRVRDLSGYYMLAVPNIKHAGYSLTRISQFTFEKAKNCDDAARVLWKKYGPYRLQNF